LGYRIHKIPQLSLHHFELDMNLKRYFDRVMLVHLKRRPDRLGSVTAALRECDWPFRWPTIFPAVDGTVIPCPKDWQSGGAAWGCMRSHQQILERAIMDGVKSLLILEDDVCFVSDFRNKVEAFLRDVPEDWEQLMLGGQHVNANGLPTLVKPGIYRCTDCERTHCYAIRGEFLRKLYRRWISGGDYNGEAHCDWIMGRDPEMQCKHNVYAPERFLVGQERSRSDIRGNIQARKFWNPPQPNLPVILLRAPQGVVASLRQYGFHTGHNREPLTDINSDLSKLFTETADDSEARIQRLAAWIAEMQWEVASDPFLICTIWHPEATRDLVDQSSNNPIVEVSADTLEAALQLLPKALRRPCRPALARTCVIHLQAPKRVMDGLRPAGWHNGIWRDRASSVNKNLIKLCRESQDRDMRIKALVANIRTMQNEAESIRDGVAVVWHPEIDAEMVQAATDAKVVRIAAKSVREALDEWDNAKTTFFAVSCPVVQIPDANSETRILQD
jgi:hypothetical protein